MYYFRSVRMVFQAHICPVYKHLYLQIYKALRDFGIDVEYIEFAGCTHNSWNPAFNYPGFMKWLFKQKR